MYLEERTEMCALKEQILKNSGFFEDAVLNLLSGGSSQALENIVVPNIHIILLL